MVHFPNSPLYQDVLHLGRIELIAIAAGGRGARRADGRAPLRVHPDPQFAPMHPHDQLFNGDGMVSQFRIRDGWIGFRQRYARTNKRSLRTQPARRCSGLPQPARPTTHRRGEVRGTAHTNVLVHACKLYAMRRRTAPAC